MNPAGRTVHLWRTLVAQDLALRYRGTLLGRAWPLVMPMAMLAIYGVVFGAVFRARWPGLAEDDHLGFTLNLFLGLLVHGLLAEAIGQAPALMSRNSNFVRKMVFPLPVLVAVPIGSALVNAAIGMGLVFLANGLLGSGWHATALLLPLILLPYIAMVFGIALCFAAVGVYVRDLAQLASMIVILALFTGAVFFPREMVPEALAGLVDFNPVTWPVEAARAVVLRGTLPDPRESAIYTAVSLAVLLLGQKVFSGLKRGFADVL
jgi:lipopolysaccharide transport system permease protein